MTKFFYIHMVILILFVDHSGYMTQAVVKSPGNVCEILSRVKSTSRLVCNIRILHGFKERIENSVPWVSELLKQ